MNYINRSLRGLIILFSIVFLWTVINCGDNNNDDSNNNASGDTITFSITNVNVNNTSDTIFQYTISWETTKPAKGILKYDSMPELLDPITISETEYTDSHEIDITDIDFGTTYYYIIDMLSNDSEIVLSDTLSYATIDIDNADSELFEYQVLSLRGSNEETGPHDPKIYFLNNEDTIQTFFSNYNETYLITTINFDEDDIIYITRGFISLNIYGTGYDILIERFVKYCNFYFLSLKILPQSIFQPQVFYQPDYYFISSQCIKLNKLKDNEHLQIVLNYYSTLGTSLYFDGKETIYIK